MLCEEIPIKLYQSIKEKNERRVYEAWHASSISDCPRSHYYKRLGIEPTKDASAALMLRWGAGHAYEKEIRPHVASVYGEAKSNERFYSKKYDMTGEFDNLILSDSRLVEIKTVHDSAFIEKDGRLGLKKCTGTRTFSTGKIVKTWDIQEEPYIHHEMQNHAYVLLLREHGIKVEVTGIDYIYISLSGRIVCYQTKIKQDILNRVLKRLEILNKAWKEQKPPECICHENHELYSSVMQYCDYSGEDECCSLKLLEKTLNGGSNGK